MRVVTLTENTANCPELACEHGLSLYIETDRHRILFDAGQTGVFADNAQKLGIDLGSVDFAVLSHGHFDHSGGLARFLEINKTAPVYLHRDAFLPRYNGTDEYIGLDPALMESKRLVFMEDDRHLAEDITLKTCKTQPLFHSVDSFGLQVEENGQRKPDDFHHELYLLLEEKGKTVCFSGCSHRGVLNIVRWLQPDVLFGGFHFMKLDPQTDAERLEKAAQELLQKPAVYYTGHCTGQLQFDFLKARMGERLHALATGTQVHL